MKHLFFFVLCFFIGITAIFGYRQYTLRLKIAPIQTPLSEITPFSLSVPPKDSLRGNILSFSGDTLIQAREATEPAVLTGKTTVLQGEEYWTGDASSLEIEFPKTEAISLFANTHVFFVQTLSQSFAVLQDSGEVRYTKLQSKNPFSIRVFHLLVQQNSGILTLRIDDRSELITLSVEKGSVTVAFNDSDNISQVITIAEGNIYTFDDESRSGEISSIDE